MKMEHFIRKLMDVSVHNGISCAEAYIVHESNFQCKAVKGQISDYSVNETMGVGLRGMVNGKIGYAASEAFDNSAVNDLISGVIESAELSEDDSGMTIYHGEIEYPTVKAYNPALDRISINEKLQLCLDIEKEAMQHDKRIDSVPYCFVETSSGQVRLVNSLGLDIAYQSNHCAAFLMPVAKDGECVSTATAVCCNHDFQKISAKDIAVEAVERALFALHGKPVESGNYRVIIINETMAEFLSAFIGVFSAENAQEGMSLLNNKEGEMVASESVTLIDDPLLENGIASKPFDAEGVACNTKSVICDGKLITLLHNRKTASKQGIASTGNAGKAGYAGTIRIQPTNFFIKPGCACLSEMEKSMGDGLVITSLDGLHSGTNAVSGDFSLAAKGYMVCAGVKVRPVEQITIAGNFYSLLKSIRDIGNDLVFPGFGIGSPSVDIGEISVAGL